MALNIKDKETEALVNEIASLTGETQTEAVRQAAKERLERLDYDPMESPEKFRHFMETEIWPTMSSGEWFGKEIPKALREEWLGYGPDRV